MRAVVLAVPVGYAEKVAFVVIIVGPLHGYRGGVRVDYVYPHALFESCPKRHGAVDLFGPAANRVVV